MFKKKKEIEGISEETIHLGGTFPIIKDKKGFSHNREGRLSRLSQIFPTWVASTHLPPVPTMFMFMRDIKWSLFELSNQARSASIY